MQNPRGNEFRGKRRIGRSAGDELEKPRSLWRKSRAGGPDPPGSVGDEWIDGELFFDKLTGLTGQGGKEVAQFFVDRDAWANGLRQFGTHGATKALAETMNGHPGGGLTKA